MLARRLLPSDTHQVPPKQNQWIVCKLTADNGDGTYNAVEYFDTGGGWVTNATARTFDSTAGHKPLRHINDNDGIAVDSYVIAFPVGVQATPGEQADWVFGEPGAADPWHPYKAKIKTGSMDKITVGYLRNPVYTPADQMSILDQDDPNQTTQIKTVADTAPVDSAALSGDGYLYYLLKRDLSGNWSHDDDPQRPHSSAAWPPTPDVRDRIPVLIGTFEDAGTSNFSWHQVLRDDPFLWPRPMLPSFYPIYCTDPSPTPHAAVIVAAGKVNFRSGANCQTFDIPAQTLNLTLTKFYYLEALSSPAVASNVVGVVQKVEAAYPGYATNPSYIRYLIGKTDGARYIPNTIGDITDGTAFCPNWTANQYIDNQGERVFSGTCVHITGAGSANSDFLSLWKPGFHFKLGDLDKMDDGGPAVTIGGTDDDVEVKYVYDVTLDCSNHRLVVKHKKFTLTVVSGIVTVNKIEDEADTYINLVSVDAVTALQVSGLKFQKKTTKLYGLCNDAETGWSTWHTGTNCPTP